MRAPLVNLNQANNQATQILQLQHVFRTGAPVRGVPQDYKPTFWEKLKLCFDKEFKLMAGGTPIEGAGWWLKARAIFAMKFTLKKVGRIIGRGFYEQDLVNMGYSSRELTRLVDAGLLRKVTTKHPTQGGWRNTYVCLMDVNEEEILNAQK